jgi:D-beta-D-heptose 7-phosphate kinase/D-beta-D-heptose 1-phosphate adenosyltransferase
MQNNFFYDPDRIIFTNGCFDLLHIGHVKFLQACKALGGRLVVGLNTDSSVRRLKGETRPIINDLHRKHMLLALECVDEVILFPEDNPLDIIEILQPEIYVKSDEYLNVDLPEFHAVKAYGGHIAIVTPDEELRKVKTSNLVKQIFETEVKERL